MDQNLIQNQSFNVQNINELENFVRLNHEIQEYISNETVYNNYMELSRKLDKLQKLDDIVNKNRFYSIHKFFKRKEEVFEPLSDTVLNLIIFRLKRKIGPFAKELLNNRYYEIYFLQLSNILYQSYITGNHTIILEEL